MEDISKLKFSIYALKGDENQDKTVVAVVARMVAMGVLLDNITYNLANDRAAKAASRRAGRPVRLPRFFIGDTPPRKAHNKRLTGGAAWMEGWLDAEAHTVDPLKCTVEQPDPPAPETSDELHPEAPANDDTMCPHCKIKDEQIKAFKNKAELRKGEITKAHSRIRDLKHQLSTGSHGGVSDDNTLEREAQFQAAVGAMTGASRELVHELGNIREERCPKPYTLIGVAHAVQDCTELMSQLRTGDQEKMESIREILWQLTTLR